MSTEDNKAIARWLYEEALNTGDIAVVDELVAPTIVLHYDYPADIAGPVENQLGLEAIKHFVSHLRTTFPDYHFTVELQVAEGDLVVTRGTAVVATWDIRSLNRPFASVRYLAFITFLGECMELPRKSRTGIPILSTRS